MIVLIFIHALWITASSRPINIIYAWIVIVFFLLFIRFTEQALLLLFLSWAAIHIFIMQTIGLSVAGVDITVGRLIGFILVIGLGLHLIINKLIYNCDIIQHKLQWAFTIFFIWAGITILYSTDKIEGLAGYIRMMSSFVLLLVIPNIFSNLSNRLRFLKIITICGTLAAIFSILSYLKIRYGVIVPFLPSESVQSIQGVMRSVGSLGSSGATAGFLLVTISCSLYLYEVSNSPSERLTYLLSIIFMTFGTFATLIRTGIIGLLLFFTVWAFIKAVKKKAPGIVLKISFGLIIVLIMGAAFIGEEVVRARLSDVPFIGSVSMRDPSAGMGRVSLWTNLYHSYIGSDFLTKIVGRGMYGTYKTNPTYGAHNDYIRILTDFGIVGIFCYLYFLFLGLKLSVALSKKSNIYVQNYGFVLFALIIAFSLSQAVFGDTITSTSHRWYFTAMLALGIAAKLECEVVSGKEIKISKP